MILGLGVSHQRVNAALGVNMPSPTVAMRRYASEVANWLRGEGPTTHLPQESAPVPVPLYLAAMTSPMVELAGELADAVMPFMWPTARVTQSKVWAARGRAKAPGRGPLDVALGIPTFVGDDIEAQRNAARANLALFTTFAFYQKMFRASGFTEEAAKAEEGVGGDALSDRMLDATCLELRRSALNAQRQALIDQREQLTQQNRLWDRVEGFAHRVRATMDRLNFAQRQKLLRLVVEEVRVTGWQVEIRFRIPLDSPPESPTTRVSSKDRLRSLHVDERRELSPPNRSRAQSTACKAGQQRRSPAAILIVAHPRQSNLLPHCLARNVPEW
jgi:hypothetical protein